MSKFAKTPKPPYYAVIFTSIRSEMDDGYADISKRLLKELARQPGFLGYEGARQDMALRFPIGHLSKQ